MPLDPITPLNVQLNGGISLAVQYIQNSVFSTMKDMFKRIISAQCEQARDYLKISLALLEVNPGATPSWV